MITFNLKHVMYSILFIIYIALGYCVFTFKMSNVLLILVAFFIIMSLGVFIIIINLIADIHFGTISKEWKINLPKFSRNTEKDKLMEAYGKALMSGNKANAERVFQELIDKNYL